MAETQILNFTVDQAKWLQLWQIKKYFSFAYVEMHFLLQWTSHLNKNPV